MSLAELVRRRVQDGEHLVFGESSELHRLFGIPLPDLPPGEEDEEGEEKLFVEVHPELREAFDRYYAFLVDSISAGERVPARPGGRSVEEGGAEYESILAEILRKVLLADRRLGLDSLFWLAHSQDVAEVLTKHTTMRGARPHLPYQVHPLLSGLYRRVGRKVLNSFSRSEQRRNEFRRGGGGNEGLVRAIITDQLPLTEVDLGSFDAEKVLVPQNRRFRLSARAFRETARIFRERIEKGVAGEEKALLETLRSTAPSLSPRTLLESGGLERYVYQRPVVDQLLQDLEGVVLPLMKNRVLKEEKDSTGGWQGLLSGYLDVTGCVLRTQVISLLRRSLVVSSKGLDDRKTREKFLEGRLYRFSRHTEIVSTIRQVVLLFGDLRDFTRISEGAISEQNLAAELYQIFDPTAIVISTFGGKIDKYLGDGFMATFGAERRGYDDCLAALRAAVAIQRMLERLRQLKKTAFTMGISLHSGRVAIARFLLDESRGEVTPIGRQVNIAGRLSSSNGAELVAEEGRALPGGERDGTAGNEIPSRPEGGVTIDDNGSLINNGIAVSSSFLEDLKKSVSMEPFPPSGRRGSFFHDEASQMTMSFDYVGEASFKGIEGTLSIYSLTAEGSRNG